MKPEEHQTVCSGRTAETTRRQLGKSRKLYLRSLRLFNNNNIHHNLSHTNTTSPILWRILKMNLPFKFLQRGLLHDPSSASPLRVDLSAMELKLHKIKKELKRLEDLARRRSAAARPLAFADLKDRPLDPDEPLVILQVDVL
jgi:hypothetical protein